MADEPETIFRLDQEQRERVKDCLRKHQLILPPDHLKHFIGGIEASIAHFFSILPEGTFRDAHDALRDLAALAGQDDPPIGQLKVRIANLPTAAKEFIGRRVPTVMQRLGFDLGGPAAELPDQAFDRFWEWMKTPEAVQPSAPPPPLPKELAGMLGILAGSEPVSLPPLVTALRLLSSEGARLVDGRSRGGGKRSRRRLEGVIMGEVRGSGTARHRGGRPRHDHNETLVMQLARHWLTVTGKPPESGRTDNIGFGDLVHSVFQWLGQPEGSAANALREYWSTVKTYEEREPLEDFLRRHGEKL